MAHHARTARTRKVILLVFTTAIFVAGCATQSSPAITDAQSRPSGGITSAQAQEAVRAYETGNNQVNASMDASGIPRVETEPLSTSSQAWLKISKALTQTVPSITSSSNAFIIPSQTGYPRWFLDISQRSRGGVPYPQPTYAVYVQQTASSSFRVAYALTPSEEEVLPTFQRDTHGAPQAVTSDAGLVIPFKALGKAISAHYLERLSGKDAFTYSDALDGQLATGFGTGQTVLKERGVSLQRALTLSPAAIYALRTSDGGALVFNWVEVTDTLTSKNGHALASLRAGGNDAALLGQPKGATAEKFTILRLEMFMTYVPLASSGKKAKVITYSETGISVTASSR